MLKKEMDELLWKLKEYFEKNEFEQAKEYLFKHFNQKPKQEPPTEAEFIDFFVTYVKNPPHKFFQKQFGKNGCNVDINKVKHQAILAFRYYESNDWRNAKGRKIIRWKNNAEMWINTNIRLFMDYSNKSTSNIDEKWLNRKG